MMERFGSRITFLTIYILEAHAIDTWPMGFEQNYKQTTSLQERASVCSDFVKDNSYPYSVRIDAPPEDAFNTLFAAWPLRFYVIDKNSQLTYICEPFGDIIAVSALDNYLEWYFQ